MDGDAGGLGAFGERGICGGDKFGLMAALEEAFEQEQSLILAAAPGDFKIDEQRLHEAASPRPLMLELAAMRRPSFGYLRRTERAAMCEMSAPRYPSRK